MQPTSTYPRPLLLLGILITLAALTAIGLAGARLPRHLEPARPASTAIRAMPPADTTFIWSIEE